MKMADRVDLVAKIEIIAIIVLVAKLTKGRRQTTHE